MTRSMTLLAAVSALALTACGGETPVADDATGGAGPASSDAPAATAPEAEAATPAMVEAGREAGALAAAEGSAAGMAAGSDAGANAGAILASLGEPYASADLTAGARAFRRCVSCHTVVEGGRHMVGPNLHGLFGREVGMADGFRYSRALQEADFIWTPDQLEEWLANPRGFLPGNAMSFAGLRNEDERHALIAYLAVESAN